MDKNANDLSNGNGSTKSSIFAEYFNVAESFESDTRRYLMEHLLDEYGNVGQAVTYNLIQNTVDNRKQGEPLTLKFEFSTKEKTFRYICSGTTGIKDWERYNSLHREGEHGITRRGEGGKVLIPIAESVRTETKLEDGTYKQSIWKENQIWRSDKDLEKGIFVHFPPSALSPGSTMIMAYGLFDEVGDRKAGIELANPTAMEKIILQDWWLYLKDNPDTRIIYSVDEFVIEIKPWDLPELDDSKEYSNLEVINQKGMVIGKIEKIFIGLAKTILKDTPPPAIAFSTGTHIVTYQTIWHGPNSTKCFGYVKATFLSASETSNHLSFKSTSAWRFVREKVINQINNFMSMHLVAMESLTKKNLKAINDVTDQINQLIQDRFPDWHPGGGFKQKVPKPEPPKDPYIRKPATDLDRYIPSNTCHVSFEVVNPDKRKPSRKVEARAKVVSPSGNEVYHKTWDIDLLSSEYRSILDMFTLDEVAEIGSYLVRFSLMDISSNKLLDERRISFEVGEEIEEPKIEEPVDSGHPKPDKHDKDEKKKEKKDKKGSFALKPCYTATFPDEEGVIRESYFDGEENRVILNDTAQTFKLSLQNSLFWKYHIVRCMIEELARLKLNRDINILEPDEVTREKCFLIYEEVRTTKSTFMGEWAKLQNAAESK